MSETTTPAEAEATRETVTFKHFDREWSVPSRQRFTHMRSMHAFTMQGMHPDAAIVETFLSGEQIAALAEIDPDDQELDGFTSAITRAMGYGESGNS